MTLLADPPEVEQRPTAPATPAGGPALRLAVRLARREVRRRRGRTALVALLVAVPLAAMTAGSVVYRTVDDDWPATFERRFGSGDLAVIGSAPTVRAVVPPGSEITEFNVTWTGVELADGSNPLDVWVRFTALPVGHQLAGGAIEVRSGRAPAAPDEMMVDADTARRLGVRVGDTLSLARPAGDWLVVGTGRWADNHREGLMVVSGFDTGRFRDGAATTVRLIDLPAGSTEAEGERVLSALQMSGVEVQSRWRDTSADTSSVAPLAWGWVAGVLALVGVGIVIASAFATSARRQLVTIGHLAANGAPPALVRRTLALQGTWTGVVGAAVGITAGLVGVAAFRGAIESLVNRSIGGLRIVPLDLLVIALTGTIAATVAAAVPARGAAQVPVLSALAGRRPLAAPSRRLVPIGLGLFLGGLGLLFVAGTGARSASNSGADVDVFALVAVLGGVAVVFGMCCATPLAIAAVGRTGGVAAKGTWRLAARSLARTRSRSAGVVTAVGAAGALAVAGVTIAAASVDNMVSGAGLPANIAVIERWTDWWVPDDDGRIDPPRLQPLDLDGGLRADLERIVPDAELVTIRAAGFDPRPFHQEEDGWGRVGDGTDELRMDDPFVAVIVDDTVADLLDLDATALGALESGSVVNVVNPAWFVVDEEGGVPQWPITRTLVLADERGDIRLDVTDVVGNSTGVMLWSFITEARARDLGLDVVERGVVVVAPDDLTRAQRREVQARVWGTSTYTAFQEPGDPPPGAEEGQSYLNVMLSSESTQLPVELINAIIIAVAILFTLLVVAIGLSLSATESRDERDVLVAVGAKPATLNRLAGAKAVVLAGTGVLLAVPTGYLPTRVLHDALEARSYGPSAAVPWVAIGLLLVAVPTAAGVAAWAASSLARRLRPTRVTTALGE